MASDPGFDRSELTALARFARLVVDAGRSAQRHDSPPLASARWAPFDPERAINDLPRRVSSFLARYSWGGSTSTADAMVQTLAAALDAAGFEPPLSVAELRGIFVAAAVWSEPSRSTAFTDDRALSAIEELNGLINGLVQSLPIRRIPDEHPDLPNRRLRAYQRRRYGYDVAVRAPQVLIRRLPPAAVELVDTYADRLLYTSAEAAHSLAAAVAVAMGRPIDDTFSRQLDVTLATAMVWRELSELPAGNDAHPLLGKRPDDDADTWDKVAATLQHHLELLVQPEPSGIDPTHVQAPAQRAIAGAMLDAPALTALQQLDDYVTTFTAWIRIGGGQEVDPRSRVTLFDQAYRGGGRGASSGAEIVASLPPQTVRIIASFDALTARGKSGDDIADQVAIALGDRALHARHLRTLEVAAAWLTGELSTLELEGADEVGSEATDRPTDADHQPALDLLAGATQRDAEALLDFGAAVAELVRFSQTLNGSGRTPEGWWVRLHKNTSGNGLPTPAELMSRLGTGAHALLDAHTALLGSEHVHDLTSASRALASALGRMHEEPCVRTLAVALSVGMAWRQLQQHPGDARSDTLLGASPTGRRERYLLGRAQAELEWGLQEILHTDTVVGV